MRHDEAALRVLEFGKVIRYLSTVLTDLNGFLNDKVVLSDDCHKQLKTKINQHLNASQAVLIRNDENEAAGLVGYAIIALHQADYLRVAHCASETLRDTGKAWHVAVTRMEEAR